MIGAEMIKRIFSVSSFLFLFGISTALAGSLHEAAKSDDIEQTKQLLAQGAVPDERDSAGETPLTLAAFGGHLEIVRVLVGKGADMHARNEGGLTPLHAASYQGHVGVAQWLLENGAQVNASDNFYRAAPLHLAAEENRRAVVELLLTHGADIGAQERNGYTPLTQAGWREYWNIAGILMQAGATCQPVELVGEWLHKECSERQ